LDPKKFLPQGVIDRVKKLEQAWQDVKKESEKKN
jgi:hypothetical protein